MGRVYRARDTERGETVALKVLHPHVRSDELVVERLAGEVEAVRGLDDEHIVGTLEWIEQPGCLVLEYVDGRDLATKLAVDGPLEVGRAVDWVGQMLAGLSAAHEAGIIHRDLKPANLLIGEDRRVRIADFGLARLGEVADESTRMTAQGTAEYMAPEQFSALSVDARADLYAVGVTLFEMMTGEVPFRAASPEEMAEAHRSADRRELLDALPEEAESLRPALRRALAAAPEARFETAERMRRALQEPQVTSVEFAPRELPSETCPNCEQPLIFGGAECLECGADIERLVRRPGGGNHRVFIPDQEFPDRYDSEEDLAEALCEVVVEMGRAGLADQSTGAIGQTPTLFAAGLTGEDAERVVDRLEEVDIEARALPDSLLGSLRLYWPAVKGVLSGLLGVLGYGFLNGSNILHLFIPGGLYTDSGAFKTEVIAAFLVQTTVASLLLVGIFVLVSQYVEITTQPVVDYRGEEALSSGSSHELQPPAAIVEAYRTTTQPRIRRTLRRLLSQAVRVQGLEADDRDTETLGQQVDLIVDEAAIVARDIVRAEQERPEGSVEQLRRELERLDRTIAAGEVDSTVSEEVERKAELRAHLARLDEAMSELDRCVNKLLGLSARLRELERRYGADLDTRQVGDEESGVQLPDGIDSEGHIEEAAEARRTPDREVSA
jgi:hypothetical protein